MAIVYVVRHGNTFDKGDTVLRVGGGTDLPLSSSGQAQAAALGDAFSAIQFDSAIVSPLKRTRMTAEAILSVQAKRPPTEFSDDLIEVDYGPDEGKPEDAVIARIGQSALDSWEADAIVPSGWKVDPVAMQQAWRALLINLTGTVVIVTSNGVARFLLDVATHDGVDRKLKTGAYGRLEGAGDAWTIAQWNVRP